MLLVHNGIVFGPQKENIMPPAATGMKVGGVTVREVRERQTLSHFHGNLKTETTHGNRTDEALPGQVTGDMVTGGQGHTFPVTR